MSETQTANELLHFFSFSSTALAGGYSCVTLTLTLAWEPVWLSAFSVETALAGGYSCVTLTLTLAWEPVWLSAFSV